MAASDNPILIELDAKDWDDICEIMRSLTWGKHDVANIWHRMRERIEEKKFVKVTEHVLPRHPNSP